MVSDVVEMNARELGASLKAGRPPVVDVTVALGGIFPAMWRYWAKP
jgi:hypothetical protein